MPHRVHHYALETSITLGTCLQRLRETLETVSGGDDDDDEKRQRYAPLVLYDLEASLMEIQRLLHAHLVLLIERERELLLELEYALLEDGDGLEDSSFDRIPSSLHESVEVLQLVVKQKKQRQAELEERKIRERSPILTSQPAPKSLKNGSSGGSSSTTGEHSMEQPNKQRRSEGTDLYGRRKPPTRSRTAEDTMLFRLTVALQLCILRIDDAHYALTGHRQRKSNGQDFLFEDVWMDRLWKSIVVVTTCTSGSILWKRHQRMRLSTPDTSAVSAATGKGFVSLAGGVTATVAGIWIARWVVKRMWMKNKIVNSIASLEEWTQQWTHTTADELVDTQSGNKGDNKSQRLIDYALKSSPKSAFWHSEGEIRFQLLKRAMDLFYASVGKAIATHEDSDIRTSTSDVMQVSLTAMAAASYYNLVGPHRAASRATTDPSSRNRLIHTAWSMISLPSIKLFSLRATRLLKGAALAERITIAGVRCFVLSKAPCPEVAAAIKRYQRQERRRGQLVSMSGHNRKLSVIDEDAEVASSPSLLTRSSSLNARLQSRGCGFLSSTTSTATGVYRRRDVIFHLTGGGFFAHTLASDLPYLLDWSAKTGAIVICPEYSLLPEHPFPEALEEVVDVYTSLLTSSSMDIAAVLGFEVDQIIVTGESAGGNLAASLLLKLISGQQKAAAQSVLKERQRGSETTSSSSTGSSANSIHNASTPKEIARLPNALMLSCPALNLSLELSPSRVIGHDDPVLPTGLISAISDAYIPESVSKEDPLASPFFADDRLLRQFPPTLLFASTDDPLLDDSVEFNRRLRCLGVPSELRAVQHVPHAYWGLATAGFPEAQQVQGECVEFLSKHLQRRQQNDNKIGKYIT